MILFRLLGVMLAVTLLLWAYDILSNIWQYNDSGAATYLVISAIPGSTGLLLLCSSLRPPRRARRSE